MLLAGLATLSLLLVGAFCVLVLVIFSSSDFRLIIWQDCAGVPIEIMGLVQDENRRPIRNAEVHIHQVGFDEHPIDLRLMSDEAGRFVVDDYVSMFACDNLLFTISARGFEPKTLDYTLFDDYTEHEISTTEANLVSMEITLERSN